jgi:DNA-binding transcriptional MerR regulator
MAEPSIHTDIPNRALFKATEVCELVKVQPYVLRSWEAEFPQLGVAKTAGGPRIYRRHDVEQAMRIRHLLLVDGLTLAGVRRRLEEETAPVGAGGSIEELISQNARERLTEVKRGLHAILELLAGRATVAELRVPVRSSPSVEHRATRGRAEPARGKKAPSPARPVARRKRSA